MFAGTLRDLGLHRDQHDGISPAALRRELRTDRKMCANVLPISRSSLQAVKNYIMAKATASETATICRQDGVPLVCHEDRWYDRQSAMTCPGRWKFQEGDWVTFVAFHENWNTAASQAQGVGPNGAVPVHIIWRMMFKPHKPAGSTYKFIVAYASPANGPNHVARLRSFPAANMTPLQKSRDVCLPTTPHSEELTATKTIPSRSKSKNAKVSLEESKPGANWAGSAMALQGLKYDDSSTAKEDPDRIFEFLITAALALVGGVSVVVYWSMRQSKTSPAEGRDKIPFMLVPNSDAGPEWAREGTVPAQIPVDDSMDDSMDDSFEGHL